MSHLLKGLRTRDVEDALFATLLFRLLLLIYGSLRIHVSGDLLTHQSQILGMMEQAHDEPHSHGNSVCLGGPQDREQPRGFIAGPIHSIDKRSTNTAVAAGQLLTATLQLGGTLAQRREQVCLGASKLWQEEMRERRTGHLEERVELRKVLHEGLVGGQTLTQEQSHTAVEDDPSHGRVQVHLGRLDAFAEIALKERHQATIVFAECMWRERTPQCGERAHMVVEILLSRNTKAARQKRLCCMDKVHLMLRRLKEEGKVPWIQQKGETPSGQMQSEHITQASLTPRDELDRRTSCKTHRTAHERERTTHQRWCFQPKANVPRGISHKVLDPEAEYEHEQGDACKARPAEEKPTLNFCFK
mmetsp:Transcript_1146/g.2733  ORF Transcript_1146/g.2733 Transcript_1146/m.2733 type:complete len:359 (+) Transcript_1146:2076-3152(+)